MSGIHLVLDLDETLIGSRDKVIYARPFLNEFLAFCFRYADSVSIWTAASPLWCKICLDKLIRPLMHSEWQFAHILTDVHCKVIRRENFDDAEPTTPPAPNQYWAQVIKPLALLWARNVCMTPQNTIAIDDTKSTGNENPRNILYINAFKLSDATIMKENVDTELLTMIGQLQLIMELYKTAKDVQKIELNSCPPIII